MVNIPGILDSSWPGALSRIEDRDTSPSEGLVGEGQAPFPLIWLVFYGPVFSVATKHWSQVASRMAF